MTVFSSTRARQGAPLRILVLCGGTHVFGLERMTLGVLRGLASHGHDVRCVATAWNDGTFVRELDDMGIPHTTVYFGKLSLSPRLRHLKWSVDALLHLPWAMLKCRRYVRAFAPDVAIVCNRDWMVLAAPALGAVPVIYHVHDVSTDSRPVRWLYRQIERMASAYAACSQNVADRLAARGASRDKIRVVYNGLPDATLSMASGRAVREVPVLGIVGQIGAWKGHDDLFAALATLRAEGYRFRCEVIGVGAPEYLRALRAEADRLGIADRIVYRGYVSDRAAIYGGLDLCVVPSRCEEAFGLVAAEAGQHGLPVVATRHGGLAEIIVDGVTGFLVPPDNPNALARSIASLLTDATLRKRLGAAARARVAEMFSEARMTSALEALCVDVVGHHAPARTPSMGSAPLATCGAE